MILPGAELAVVEIDKLRDYCLSPSHPRGRHKARVFASALQLFRSDADWLKAQLLEAVLTTSVMEGFADEYGTRFNLDFHCTRGDLNAWIRSSWIIKQDEGFPRLTTCFVLSKRVLND